MGRGGFGWELGLGRPQQAWCSPHVSNNEFHVTSARGPLLSPFSLILPISLPLHQCSQISAPWGVREDGWIALGPPVPHGLVPGRRASTFLELTGAASARVPHTAPDTQQVVPKASPSSAQHPLPNQPLWRHPLIESSWTPAMSWACASPPAQAAVKREPFVPRQTLPLRAGPWGHSRDRAALDSAPVRSTASRGSRLKARVSQL